MAKLVAPLFSLNASGSIGEALTFSNRRSGAQVRFQKKQKDKRSDDQLSQRELFKTARDWWHTLTPAEQAEWKTEGDNP